jgi:hypothetical protein
MGYFFKNVQPQFIGIPDVLESNDGYGLRLPWLGLGKRKLLTFGQFKYWFYPFWRKIPTITLFY